MYDVSRFSFSWGTVAVGCVVHTWFFFFISSPPPFQVVLSIARAILNTRGIVRLLSTAAVVSLQSYTSFMNPRDRTTNVRRFELSGQRVQAGYISCGKKHFCCCCCLTFTLVKHLKSVVTHALFVVVCCSHINSHNQVRGHSTRSSHSGAEEYPEKKTNTPRWYTHNIFK